MALTCGIAYFGVSAVAGSTEIPMPDVTMLRMVSSELPSLPCTGGRVNSWQASSTWSRKQWPTLSSSRFCAASSSGRIVLAPRPGMLRRHDHAKLLAVERGDGRCPAHQTASATIAASIAPDRSIASRFAVRFSSMSSGIRGADAQKRRHELRQQVGRDRVDDAEAQRPVERVAALRARSP